MCPEISIVHKDCSIFDPMTQNLQIAHALLRVSGNFRCVYGTTIFQNALSFRRVSGSFEHVLKKFPISKKFLHLSGNF